MMSPGMTRCARRLKNDQGCSDGNCGIGKIEGGPAKIAGAQFQKIRDAAMEQPVQEISRRSSGNQCHANLAFDPACIPCEKQPDQQQDHRRRT
jgi:hypothetical protein